MTDCNSLRNYMRSLNSKLPSPSFDKNFYFDLHILNNDFYYLYCWPALFRIYKESRNRIVPICENVTHLFLFLYYGLLWEFVFLKEKALFYSYITYFI